MPEPETAGHKHRIGVIGAVGAPDSGILGWCAASPCELDTLRALLQEGVDGRWVVGHTRTGWLRKARRALSEVTDAPTARPPSNGKPSEVKP